MRNHIRIVVWLPVMAAFVAATSILASDAELGEDASRANFALSVRGLSFDLKVMSLFVLPGESVKFAAADSSTAREFSATANAGEMVSTTTAQWQWTAPAIPGLCSLTVACQPVEDTITLHIFVMYPYDRLKDGYLNGYHIGKYPTIAYKSLAVYEPPKGFVEVTPEIEQVFLTPHFRLVQFICKQSGDYPKYVVLREELLMKLEMILAAVNERGYSCKSFNVLSGYRTPWYNKSIGNVKYSRHQWGGAADIFIDENPADGMMDDLNKDGHINWRDAAILYDIIDDMYGMKFYEKFIGGLARYRKTKEHGPFVHVDVRGFRARWGD